MARAAKESPKIDPKHIIEIEGHSYVKYPGILDLAHQKGLFKMEVEALQFPTADNNNVAICKATVTSKDGEVFSDIGDASPENVGSRVKKHLLRISSTRACARALRSYTATGECCFEEISSDSNAVGNGNGGVKQEKPAARKRPPAAKAKPDNGNGNGGNEKRSTVTSQPGITDAQRRAVFSLSKRKKIDETELREMAKISFGSDVDHLSCKEASILITQLQKSA